MTLLAEATHRFGHPVSKADLRREAKFLFCPPYVHETRCAEKQQRAPGDGPAGRPAREMAQAFTGDTRGAGQEERQRPARG